MKESKVFRLSVNRVVNVTCESSNVEIKAIYIFPIFFDTRILIYRFSDLTKTCATA